MGEKPEQIEQHIEETRRDLADKLYDLEYRVKRETDWRVHYRRHTLAALLAAFGGGLALAAISVPARKDVFARWKR
jgi:hypothetical protein